MSPRRALLPDGRLHYSHGPIDLVIHAEGPRDAVDLAHASAWRRFETVLPELVAELPLLRQPVGDACPLRGKVARRMWEACYPYRAGYITPMAAVAGAVAEEILECYRAPRMLRAAVNNGGDIAFHLSAGARYRVGLCTDMDAAAVDAQHGELRPDGELVIGHEAPVRGVATSGWKGRSFSLGIADSVTVTAATAAQADAAATVIANAVYADDERIVRRPANELKDDTDLGALPVTVEVPALETAVALHALRAGYARACELQDAGLIHAALLVCQGHALQLGAGSGRSHPPPVPRCTNATPAFSY